MKKFSGFAVVISGKSPSDIRPSHSGIFGWYQEIFQDFEEARQKADELSLDYDDNFELVEADFVIKKMV